MNTSNCPNSHILVTIKKKVKKISDVMNYVMN